MLYNIAMIQHYSRCVIRQLLWLRSTYPNVLFRLGFYMCFLQELSASWLPRQAPDRGAPETREHETRESHDNRLRHILLGPWGTRGILMYKEFPRNLYSTECHTYNNYLYTYNYFPYDIKIMTYHTKTAYIIKITAIINTIKNKCWSNHIGITSNVCAFT